VQALVVEEIVHYYKGNPCDSRYDNISVSMLREQATNPPKLRGRADEVRGLVPFAHQIAQELLSDLDPKESTVKQCAVHLLACYSCLSAASFDSEVIAERTRKLCLLWVALEAAAPEPRLWRVKPKLHLFQHLCEAGSRPATCWTYRDEDFGGSMARLGSRRMGEEYPPAHLPVSAAPVETTRGSSPQHMACKQHTQAERDAKLRTQAVGLGRWGWSGVCVCMGAGLCVCVHGAGGVSCQRQQHVRNA
jgi:hypothetical protein